MWCRYTRKQNTHIRTSCKFRHPHSTLKLHLYPPLIPFFYSRGHIDVNFLTWNFTLLLETVPSDMLSSHCFCSLIKPTTLLHTPHLVFFWQVSFLTFLVFSPWASLPKFCLYHQIHLWVGQSISFAQISIVSSLIFRRQSVVLWMRMAPVVGTVW